jgi:hypothetical protein
VDIPSAPTAPFPNKTAAFIIKPNPQVPIVQRMSFQVSVLWFKNATSDSRNDYHWSLFISPAASVQGTKYDAVNSGIGVTEWNYSYLPNYNKTQSALFGGEVVMGIITSEEAFKALMLSTPLPTDGENCQTWISNVVYNAVQQGILNEAASQAIQSVPVRL